jgi:hypothetical protein
MQWTLALPGACLVFLALMMAYLPTIYIRKTNRLIKLLEQIEANTRTSILAEFPNSGRTR